MKPKVSPKATYLFDGEDPNYQIIKVTPPILNRDQISPPGTVELQPAQLELIYKEKDDSAAVSPLPPCASPPEGLITAEMQRLMDALTSSLPTADTASTFLQPSTSIRSMHQQVRYPTIPQYYPNYGPVSSRLPPIPSPIPSPLPTPFLPLLNSYLSEKILKGTPPQTPVLALNQVQSHPKPLSGPRRTTTAKELLDLLDL
jgi:hypothetical protein